MKKTKITDRAINSMQRSTKMAIVLLLIASVLPLSGCSDTAGTEIPPNVEPVSQVSDNDPDAKEEDASIPAADDDEKVLTPKEDTSENEPVRIKITRDDRSVPMTEYGKDDGVFTYYYETALLPDSVKNHEKINRRLEEKKEDFFRTNGGFEEQDLKENLDFGSDKECLIAAVKSVYLDEKYYSLAIEQYYSFGSGFSKLTGYTFDLNSGEEVGIEQVLEKKDDALSSLLYNKIKSYFEDYTVADQTKENDFLNNESFGSFDYCISRDGCVYLLYDENRFLAGYMGCSACAVDKYPGCNGQALFSEMKEFSGGEWYSLSLDRIDRVREFLKLKRDDYDDARDRVPCFRDNEWYVPVLFSRRFDNGDQVFASAEAKADDPTYMSDTREKMYEDILGEWYSIESCEDKKTGETVPLFCCTVSENTMRTYDYDPSECCYKLKDTKSIWIKRTMWRYIIEADNYDTGEKVTYITNDWDDCRLDMYKSEDNEGSIPGSYGSYSEKDSMINRRSADFERIFKTDRSLLLYPADDCVSQSLSVPAVRDGKTLPGPDCVEVHFTWDAVPGSSGYEVLEESKYVEDADDSYTYPGLSETSDHYYVTGAQDDFDFRIRVRAYKTDGGRRIFSEWSDYATGGIGSYYDLDQTREADGEMKEFVPALDEYAKVFGKDESVYGLRAPDDLYYKVNSFDQFNINDFCYAYYDFDLNEDDNAELVILKNADGKDLLYSVYYAAYHYPENILFDDIISTKEGEEYYTSGVAKEGEDICLYDNGIIAKERKQNGCTVWNYLRLNKGFYIEPVWEMFDAVACVTDDNGNSRYYRSGYLQSMDLTPGEKNDIYEEISEDEFNETRKKYEIPASIERKPFSEYTVKN